MELMVPIVLYSWIVLVPLAFRDMQRHRALAAIYVFAWLFLPIDKISFPGIPDLDKGSTTSVGLMIGIFLFDFGRVVRFRPHWMDIPICGYILSPIAASVSNELGLYDGISTALTVFFTWGFPYFAARLYFDSFDKIKDLAKAIFIGGIVYIPLCLIEVRMSPQIYNWVYGFRNTVRHALRYGGWRPLVFLRSGLELGMWMTAASLLGYALWRSRALHKIWGFSIVLPLALLFATTLLCKSTGALLLLVGGLGIWTVMKMTRSPWPAVVLLLIPAIYLPLRILSLSDGSEAVDLVAAVFGGERAQSLEFRFTNEVNLVAHALKRPWFGWGGWGRALIPDEWGEIRTIVDSFWIVTLGNNGLFGLVSAFAAFLVAPTVACFRFSHRRWGFADAGPLLALCLLLYLFVIDCLLNSMANAVYPLVLGAITTMCLQPFRQLIQLDAGREQGELPAATQSSRGRLWPPRNDQAPELEPPTDHDPEPVPQIQ